MVNPSIIKFIERIKLPFSIEDQFFKRLPEQMILNIPSSFLDEKENLLSSKVFFNFIILECDSDNKLRKLAIQLYKLNSLKIKYNIVLAVFLVLFLLSLICLPISAIYFIIFIFQGKLHFLLCNFNLFNTNIEIQYWCILAANFVVFMLFCLLSAASCDKQKEVDKKFSDTQETFLEYGFNMFKEYIVSNYLDKDWRRITEMHFHSPVGVASMQGSANNIAGVVHGSQNLNSTTEQNIYLLAAEIRQILIHLSESNATKTSQEKISLVSKAIEKIEKNPSLRSRLIEALKSAGAEAVKEAINHPLASILIAFLEGFQNA